MDWAVALLLAAFAFVLYRTTFQARQFGDSSLLVQIFAARSDGTGFWYHALYMPAAGLLGRVLPGASPPEVLRVLSSGCGALGVAFAYGIARKWPVRRPAAILAAGLLAISPGYWYFSTMIEVHTLHAACVGLCALVTLAAPWRRPLLASLWVALLLPLLFLSHQSGVLLGPGFVLLSQYSRFAGGQPPFKARTLLLGIGPLYLCALLAAIPLSAWMGHRTLSNLFSGTENSVVTFVRGFTLANAWEGWIQPLGLLIPFALGGVVAARRRPWDMATPLVFIVPSAVFFLTWGLPERGGYTLGSSMFFAVLAGMALSWPDRRVLWLGLLAVAAQGTWGLTNLRSFDTPEWRENLDARRDAIVRAIGERGGVISFNVTFQYIEAELPDVIEVSLVRDLARTMGPGKAPAEFLSVVEPRLEELLAREDLPIVLDRSYVRFFERVSPEALPYTEAVERWLSERCLLKPVEGTEGTDWPLVRVERRGTDSSR